MKKHNGGVAERVKHTRKFTGRRVNKGERQRARKEIESSILWQLERADKRR